MSVYIPMAVMTRVAADDFQKVAHFSDPDVLSAECTSKGSAKFGGEVLITRVSSVGAKPITCREAVEDNKIILCDACASKYEHAKNVIGSGVSADDAVYVAQEQGYGVATKSLKDRAIEWAKAHPYLAMAAGIGVTVSFIGVVAALANRSTAVISAAGKANTTSNEAMTEAPAPTMPVTANPVTAKPTTTKPTTASTTKPTTASTTKPTTASTTKPTTASTTKPATASTTKPTTASTTKPATAPTTMLVTLDSTPSPCRAQLDLTLYNEALALELETQQQFLNGTAFNKTHSISGEGSIKLLFDVSKDHHKNVKVVYKKVRSVSSGTAITLKLYGNTKANAPVEHNFDANFFNATAANAYSLCKYKHDKNNDGKVAVGHSLLISNEGVHTFLQKFEENNGRVSGPVLLEEVNFTLKNLATNQQDFTISSLSHGSNKINQKVSINASETATFKLGVGTTKLMLEKEEIRVGNFLASAFSVDENGDMCIKIDANSPHSKGQLISGNCV